MTVTSSTYTKSQVLATGQQRQQRIPFPHPLPDDILHLHRPSTLYIKQNTPKGRGVFTSANIKKGDVVEVSPVLVFEDEEERRRMIGMEGSLLGGYTYNWPHTTTSMTTTSRPSLPPQALPLGLGSLFNHSSHPFSQNVLWTRDIRNSCIMYTAARDIGAGEELCISYGDRARLWFRDADGEDIGNGITEDGDAEWILRVDV